MRDYDEVLNEIQALFPKHHLKIELMPSGGQIDLLPCEECGSDDLYYRLWLTWRGQTLNSSILELIEEVNKG